MEKTAPSTAKKYKLLVVEDDEQFRQALRILLTLNKYEVTECSNGREAKSVLGLGDFDLILSDIRMPHVYGTELLQYVRKTSTVPFILMTGFSDIVEATEAHKMGATAFIAKPFKPEEMLQAIGQCLPQSSETAPTATDLENQEKYCRVHIDDFLGGKVLAVDVFIQLSKNKYVKIAHKGSEVLSEQVNAYKAKNIHFLYIRESDFGSYVNLNLKLADVAAKHPTASAQLKSKILKLTQESILQDIFLMGIDKAKFDNASQVSKLTLSTACNNEDLLKLISELNTQTDYLYTHSVGVSTYSVMIGQEIGWHSSAVLFKLALAGLLHDAGKKEITRDILDKPRSQLTAAEIKTLESHAYRGKEILAEIHGVPSDVITIVLQHHENLYGQGPLGIDEKNLHPLAKVVALANRFCELTIRNPSRVNLPPEEALEKLKLLGREEFDATAFAALERLVLKTSAPKTA